ncbi:hypothetical protein Isop_2057 [Isosphaera pallida ATCC 43644]|uniref:DUF4878 domain-containing protein n=1 Tax=Isosphaera pallida (strain ATCC 43644 / DSM 9630 / IS1B) TaxID=575540 RepID=E8R3Q2_ISOPI|nr:hypothetical protein [Isosphaera pallida]ADV62637.1 hypothetical protein Isop_2057 [Isosphaera pallida ATCC 43644]
MARVSSSRLVGWLGFAWLVGLGGCGGGQPVGSGGDSIDTQVEQYIMSMADLVGSPAFSRQFVDGSALTKAELKKYEGLSFEPASRPIFSGSDACTIQVKVFDDSAPPPAGDASQEPKGIVEWSLVKQGDVWKLKSAPLP